MPKLPPRSAGWNGIQQINTKTYVCPFCSASVASNQGWVGGDNAKIYVCHQCQHPTYFAQTGDQVPGIAAGETVANVPLEVANAYEEARESLAVGAPTASVLMSRKLLMNIAVSQGADVGKSFAEYVDYLAANGFVPPNGRAWVDHIRKKGNEATHEIPQATPADAAELISFLEMLLRFIYDFPAVCPEQLQLRSPWPAAASTRDC